MRGPRKLAKSFWPHWPIAGFLLLYGFINIYSGLTYHPPRGPKPLSEIARSFAVWGSDTQVVMGSLLILTGIGGDITSTTMESRIFVVTLILVGLSIFLGVIVSTLGPAFSRELARILNPAERHMKPRNHVILIGTSQIVRNTALELADRKIPFVQIVGRDEEPLIPEHPVVHGDGCNVNVLTEAGIKKARMVIASLDDDGRNAFISLLAKDLNAQVQVLAISSSVRSIHLLRLARADMVFAPAVVGSRLLVNLVEGNEISPEFQDLLEGQLSKK